jgi:hypothetical protein
MFGGEVVEIIVLQHQGKVFSDKLPRLNINLEIN